MALSPLALNSTRREHALSSPHEQSQTRHPSDPPVRVQRILWTLAYSPLPPAGGHCAPHAMHLVPKLRLGTHCREAPPHRAPISTVHAIWTRHRISALASGRGPRCTARAATFIGMHPLRASPTFWRRSSTGIQPTTPPAEGRG